VRRKEDGLSRNGPRYIRKSFSSQDLCTSLKNFGRTICAGVFDSKFRSEVRFYGLCTLRHFHQKPTRRRRVADYSAAAAAAADDDDDDDDDATSPACFTVTRAHR